MEYRIGLIHGDGIGPEIVAQANKVLDQVAKKSVSYTHLRAHET